MELFEGDTDKVKQLDALVAEKMGYAHTLSLIHIFVCALRVEGGSVTIRGGDFGTSSPNTNSYGVLVNGEAAVTISGGTFSVSYTHLVLA